MMSLPGRGTLPICPHLINILPSLKILQSIEVCWAWCLTASLLLFYCLTFYLNHIYKICIYSNIQNLASWSVLSMDHHYISLYQLVPILHWEKQAFAICRQLTSDVQNLSMTETQAAVRPNTYTSYLGNIKRLQLDMSHIHKLNCCIII